MKSSLLPSSKSLKKAVAVACVCEFIAVQGFAATFNITGTGDAGAGTLRQAVTDANAAVGADTLAWGAGSGGVITLLSDLPGVAADTTLDVSAAPAAVTIAGAPNGAPLGGAVTFHNTNAGQDATISAILSGAGSLTKTGAGTLILTGANTHAGGTAVNGGILNINADAALGDAAGSLIFDAGTLKTAAAVASARSVVINSGGATVDTAGVDSTFSGSVSGAGGLTKIGAGILTLSGSSSYTGGTTVNAGTLDVNCDAALGQGDGPLVIDGATLRASATLATVRAVTLGAGGATFDSAGVDSALWSTVSGAGSLTKIGAGILYLRGANTYAGGILLNAGTVNIISDANLGASGSAVTFNGGTLQTAADMASSRAMTVNAGGATLEVQDETLYLSGVLSGAGAVTKSGGGTLVLTGANTFTGGTTVAAGAIRLGATNALPANRALTVNAGGSFDMGSYTQAVSAFTCAGTTRLDLQPAVISLAASGVATVTGGTLELSLGPQVVTEGQTFKPITVGSWVGTFSSIISPAALSLTPTYNGTDLTLTASFVPLASIAGTGNQRAISAGMEALRINAAGDAATVIGELNTLDATHLRAALDRVGPTALASMEGIGLGASGVHSGALSQRMAVLAGLSRGADAVSTAGRSPSPFPGVLVAEAGVPDAAPEQPEERLLDSSWGLFATGIYRDGRLREANTSAGLQPGYAFNSAGFVAGADRIVRDGLAVGLAAGYLRGHSSIYSPASGVVDSHSARFGGYATVFNEAFHGDFYLGGAVDLFSTRRDVVFAGLSRTATANPVGGEVNADAGAGYDLKTSGWGTFSPFGGLSYDRMMIGGFTEDGAGSLNLIVGRQTAESLRSRLGVKVSERYDAGAYAFTPYFSAGWRHEFLSQSRAIDAQLSAAGPVFSVKTGDYAKDGTILGAGFTVDRGRRVAFKFDYAGDYRSHFMDNVFNLGARLKF
ncbi:MAG: autotransporter domain-containing protein [Elusimicrobia bacterium]|nr:autotransporter domain-containing protein [Elusimicrobiota bacterium]